MDTVKNALHMKNFHQYKLQHPHTLEIIPFVGFFLRILDLLVPEMHLEVQNHNKSFVPI